MSCGNGFCNSGVGKTVTVDEFINVYFLHYFSQQHVSALVMNHIQFVYFFIFIFILALLQPPLCVCILQPSSGL